MKTFSIQGETGLQLRNLKEFLDNNKDSNRSTPLTPMFYKNLSKDKKLVLEYKLNNTLNATNESIMDYDEAIAFTRSYDVENNTKLLDNGYLFIMMCRKPIDGRMKGAFINLKDRTGRDLYTYSIPLNGVINHKEAHKGKLKSFSINVGSPTHKKLEELLGDAEFESIDPEDDIPLRINPDSKEADLTPDELGDLLDTIVSQGTKVSEGDDYTIYEVGQYKVCIPDDITSDSIVHIFK